MDDAHLPPLPFLSEHQQAVQCQASQMDFLIHLFAGTSVKLQPKAYLDAGAASDARLSRPGKNKGHQEGSNNEMSSRAERNC